MIFFPTVEPGDALGLGEVETLGDGLGVEVGLVPELELEVLE
jgi:hypothetical protein